MAAVSGLALMLTACGASTAATGKVAPGLNEKVIPLLGGVTTEPNSWFPIVSDSTCTTVNYAVTSLMYVPLVYVNPHDQIQFTHSIASGITVSHNDTVYTVKLNPQWKWSNGTPVTASDAVYSWDIMLAASQTSAPWAYCSDGSGGVPTDWKSVVAKNPTTLVITTTKAVNPVWFEYNGIAQIVPIPKAAFDKYGHGNRELSYIQKIQNQPANPAFHVVDGPYQEGSFVNNSQWTMVANAHYSGHVANIKKLLFEYETSTANQWAQMHRGAYATASIPNSFYAQRNELPSYYVRGTAPYSFCFNYMVPNMSSQTPGGMGPIFKQLAVRQAMQMGIDQPAMVKDLLHGLGAVESGPVPVRPTTQFYDPNVPTYPYNPAAGEKLLEKNGWTMKNGVMTNKQGKQLAFTWVVASGSTTDTNIAQLIKQDWAREGIDATIREEPFNQVVALTSSQFQVIWWGGGWCYGAEDPTGGALFGTGSVANTGLYSNSTMNRLIAATHAPSTLAQAKARMDAYQVFAAKHLPVLWLPASTGLMVTKQGLHGVTSDYNTLSGYEAYNNWKVGP